MHEHALEAESVSRKPKPQQVRMNTGELVPDNTQIFRAFGHLNAHKALHRLRIAKRMPHGANTANALGYIDELVIIARLNKLFQTTVNKADLRNSLNDLLVLHDQVKVKGLGQNRMLRSKGNQRRLAHATHRPFQTSFWRPSQPSLPLKP